MASLRAQGRPFTTSDDKSHFADSHIPYVHTPADLDLIASFFEDRVETVELENGGTAFIQRPKAKAEGSVQSAADLPDDFDINNISANSTKLYRISVGPIEIVVNYDEVNLGIEIIVKIKIPFIGSIEIGKVSGNLKQGVSLKIGYKGIASGEIGVKLDGSSVVLYWDLSAFGASYKDQVKIFSI